MSIENESDALGRIAVAKGRLLRIEADRAGPTPRHLALTFDIGRVLIQPTGETLLVSPVEEREELPSELVSLEEEEPWWRLLGNPLTRLECTSADGPEAAPASGEPDNHVEMKLRFREAAENPRVVVLRAAGASVRVSVEG